MQGCGTSSLDPAVVRAQLERLVSSSDFEASSRNRQFLRFVVEETLAGRDDLIKAYSIATCVFGRGADFDPQVDSIVRIEAGRLRRAIERYYLTAGRTDPIVISIPKGSYVPEFFANDVTDNPGLPPLPPQISPRGKLSTSILVPGFEEEFNQSDHPAVTRGFTRRVVAGLARFTELAIFGPEVSAYQSSQPWQGHGENDFDYLITGGTTISQTHFGAEVLLMEVRSGRCLWGDEFRIPIEPVGLMSARNEVADRVVRAIAQPYGAIFAAQWRDADTVSTEELSPYASVLLFRRYARKYDRNLEEAARRGLEAAIVQDPDYAEAFACLSQIYTNILRFMIDPSGARHDVGERALELAQRAIELAPNSSRSHHALSRAYWFTGHVAASFEELEIARTLNPNDTTILADFGQQHAVMANWDEAMPLLEAAYALNAGLPSAYRVGFSLFHFAHGRFVEALAEARRIDVRGIIYGHMMVAVSAVRLGRTAEAAKAMSAILQIDPDYAVHAVPDLARRNVDPGLAAALVEGLGDAGLPVPPTKIEARSARR